MGVISVEQADRLYWLGRYIERVYTTTCIYFEAYDNLLDDFGKDYKDYCRSLDIPDVYASSEDFLRRYAFDPEDPNSVISNLNRAYDNAIVLREEIGSEALAYVQLIVYEMKKAAQSSAPLLELQKILDYCMAFWGIADDMILSENTRNILKSGKRVERIDLFARLKKPREDLEREVARLTGRIPKCNLKYNKEILNNLNDLVKEDEIDYRKIVSEVESILNV